MKTHTFVLSILSALVLTACGNSDSGTTHGPSASVGGAACGSDVIADDTKVVLACNYLSTKKDAEECISMAESFLAKYPNINCVAKLRSQSSVNDSTYTVTAQRYNDIISQARSLL